MGHKESAMEEASHETIRLEGAYDHLATKAVLADLKADFIKLMVGMLVVGMAAAIAATASVVRTLG